MCAQGPNFISLSRMKYTTMAPASDREAETEELQRRQHIYKILSNNREYEQLILALKQYLEVAAADVDITEFYPYFVLDNDYQQDREKYVVDEEMGLLIYRLEDENRMLKNYLRAWSHEFGKKARLSEIMIKENGLMREQLAQKDKDLTQLIDNMACGYGQDMQLMEHRLHELTEENNLLLKHLDKTQETLRIRRYQRKYIAKLIEYTNLKKIEYKRLLTKMLDEEEHLTKLSVMKMSTLENLQRKLQKIKSDEEWKRQVNEYLYADQQELEYSLSDQKTYVSDLRKNLVRYHDYKGSEERYLRKSLQKIQGYIHGLLSRYSTLEASIQRNEANLVELDNILKNTYDKLKRENPELPYRLEKQLERYASKASELTLLQHYIVRTYARINSLLEYRKRYEKYQPKKLKQVSDNHENYRKQLEKEILDLYSKHSITLLSLNGYVNKYRSELYKLQLQLNNKREDIRYTRLKIEEARMSKQNLRGLNASLKKKAEELHSLKASMAQ